MKRARYQGGSVVFDRRRGTWHFIWRENGKRRSQLIGPAESFPTKASAQRAAEVIRGEVLKRTTIPASGRVKTLIEQYRAEKMPLRAMTRQGYNAWLNQYILPQWSERSIQDLQARPVDQWLKSLRLSPKSKVHIRGMIRILWDYAMSYSQKTQTC